MTQLNLSGLEEGWSLVILDVVIDGLLHVSHDFRCIEEQVGQGADRLVDHCGVLSSNFFPSQPGCIAFVNLNSVWLKGGLGFRIVEERVLHLFFNFFCIVVGRQMELGVLKVQPDLSVSGLLGVLRVEGMVDKS